MPVKSIIDVEVNDSAFKDFAALFEKYKSALGVTPGQWANAETAAAGTALSVESLVAGLLTHEAINRKIAREEAEKTRQLERQNRALARQKVDYRDVARSVTSVFTSIAKWATYSGVAGGLLGFGGLFGLDRLADITGSGRRNAQGLGTSYGGAKAFTNSYDRIIDSRSILGGVNEALTDPSKRAPLFAAGLSAQDIAGGDSVAISEKLIDSVKKLVDKTPTELLGAVSQARGLGALGFSTEDLRRLKATPPKELRSIEGGARARAGQFDVDDDIARKWQDLGVQLDAAKIKIEGVLVKGLEPLAKPLAELSDSLANALQLFLTGLDPNTIKDFGKDIEDFGKYLGSSQFRKDIKDFADDVSYAAKKMVAALKWLDLIPDKDAGGNDDPGAPTVVDKAKSVAAGTAVGAAIGGAVGAFIGGPGGALIGARGGAWLGGAYGLLRLRGGRLLGENAHWTGAPNDTNPTNIRWPGVNKGFAAFESSEAGIRATARQIELYEKRDHLDTISKIIARYAPKKDHNDVAAYVADVEKYTGIGANQKLDPLNIDQIAKIVAGITKHEGRKRFTIDAVKGILKNGENDPKSSVDDVTRYTGLRSDAKVDTSDSSVVSKIVAGIAKHDGRKRHNAAEVKVIIQNNTGGSAIVQANQAAKQG